MTRSSRPWSKTSARRPGNRPCRKQHAIGMEDPHHEGKCYELHDSGPKSERGSDKEAINRSRFSANAAQHGSDDRTGARKFGHRRWLLWGSPWPAPSRNSGEGFAQIALVKRPSSTESERPQPVFSDPGAQTARASTGKEGCFSHGEQIDVLCHWCLSGVPPCRILSPVALLCQAVVCQNCENSPEK